MWHFSVWNLRFKQIFAEKIHFFSVQIINIINFGRIFFVVKEKMFKVIRRNSQQNDFFLNFLYIYHSSVIVWIKYSFLDVNWSSWWVENRVEYPVVWSIKNFVFAFFLTFKFDWRTENNAPPPHWFLRQINSV